MRNVKDKTILIHQINIINAQIRGTIKYYEAANRVSNSLNKYKNTLDYAAYKALKKHGGKWTRADHVHNLTSIHSKYTTQIPAIEHEGKLIALTSVGFCRWKKTPLKNPKETPYTQEGRELFKKRTGIKSLQERADELLSLHLSELIAKGMVKRKLYNFEYFLNRAYAFNRDRGKCKVCTKELNATNVHIHHVIPNLPLNEVNKVPNLATVCKECHNKIHNNGDYSTIVPSKVWNKILKYRNKLTETNVSA